MSKHTKVETGVMAMLNGAAWGVEYADGHATVMGWVDPIEGRLSNPEFCKKPEDMTSNNRPDDVKRLRMSKLVHVTRTLTIEVSE